MSPHNRRHRVIDRRATRSLAYVHAHGPRSDPHLHIGRWRWAADDYAGLLAVLAHESLHLALDRAVSDRASRALDRRAFARMEQRITAPYAWDLPPVLPEAP